MPRHGLNKCSRLVLYISAFLAISIPRLTTALEVTIDSACSNFCIDLPSANISEPMASATFSKDLSCLDSDYSGPNSTAIGRKFRTCIACEQNSAATGPGLKGQGNENDVYWFLFNMKSTIAWCVHGFFATQQNPVPTLANTLCASACDSISTAIDDRLLQTNETLQYNYCESDNRAFKKGVNTCKNCLNSTNNLEILANFLSVLSTACTQAPPPGTTLNLTANVFSVPSQSATSTSPSSSPSTLTPISSASSTSTSTSTPSPLSSSAKTGIAIGAISGVVVLAAAASLLILRRRRRRRKATLTGGGYELDDRGRNGSAGTMGDAKFQRREEMATRQGVAVGMPPREMEGTRAVAELPGSLGK